MLTCNHVSPQGDGDDRDPAPIGRAWGTADLAKDSTGETRGQVRGLWWLLKRFCSVALPLEAPVHPFGHRWCISKSVADELADRCDVIASPSRGR